MREVARQWPSVVDVLLYSGQHVVNDLSEDVDLVHRQVLRNLENLLNYRRRPVPPPERLSELQESVLMFGIPDFTAFGFDSDRQRRQVCRQIRTVIRNFEPRLKSVDVDDLNDGEELDRMLKFRITADLQVYPHPHRVAFDSRLDRATSLFIVQEDER